MANDHNKGDSNGAAPDEETLPLYDMLFKHVMGFDEDSSTAFWIDHFKDLRAQEFPALPSPSYQPNAEDAIHQIVDGLMPIGHDLDAMVAMRTAWAILLAHQTGSNDVVFGSVIRRSHEPLASEDEGNDHLGTIVPNRVSFDWESSVSSLFGQVKQHAEHTRTYGEMGLPRIRQLSENAKQACQFQSLLLEEDIDLEGRSPESVVNAGSHAALLNKRNVQDFPSEIVNGYSLALRYVFFPEQLALQLVFDPNVLSREQVQQLANQLELILRQLHNPDVRGKTLKQIKILTPQDLRQIWQWNQEVPGSSQTCVHDIIASRTSQQPDARAIDAWDGIMTYRELDRLSSHLAVHLVSIGINLDMVLPLCFEKSKWTSVAIMAVMKAGGASVTMDVTQPEERLRMIVNRVDSPVILSSLENKALSERLYPSGRVVVVGPQSLESLDEVDNASLPIVDPSQAICVLFTSGSTGVPKGAIISHENFATSIHQLSTTFPMGPGSRTFDFASYSFDISWFNLLHSLAQGGCLCVPHEFDRTNNLQRTIIDFQTTMLFTTPTVARLLDPSALEDVKCLALGGEGQKWSDFQRWQNVVTISVYGPAECTVVSAASRAEFLQSEDYQLPPALSSCYWVTNIEDSHQLASIGTVGELWLEGPLVGQGYLKDEERTAAAFVEAPPWLTNGPAGQPGREGKLYRTGDLVRYNGNGSLSFIGRKDKQVKIRGQRVELGEVEHHVRQVLLKERIVHSVEVIVEVVTPRDSDRSALVAFICPDRADSWSEMDLVLINSMTVNLQEQLSTILPTYMVPNIYLSISKTPMTSNGKLDRRHLYKIAARQTWEELTVHNDPDPGKRPPQTVMEQCLQSLWAKVLDIDPEIIAFDSNFMRLGGDSLRAMHLVAAAREQNLVLTVAEIFHRPILYQLAQVVHIRDDDVSLMAQIEPFSLLEPTRSEISTRAQAATACGIAERDIEDAFPCTPLQEGLLTLTHKQAGDYILRLALSLRKGTDLDLFRSAWDRTMEAIPILRTRIFHSSAHQRLIQTVVRGGVAWRICHSSVDEYILEDEQRTIELGGPLSWQALIVPADSKDPPTFVWTIHHALYDGWSIPKILKAVAAFYGGANGFPGPVLPFQKFVAHVLEKSEQEAQEYWIRHFDGLEAQPFPLLPSSSYQPRADGYLQHRVGRIDWASSGFTAATMVRAAWAILIGHYTGISDVVFGAIVNGRQTAMRGIENIVGPTLGTVPVRITFNWNMSVEELSSQIQQQSQNMIEFEQTGLSKIRRLSDSAERGCQFQSLLLIQPVDDEDEVKDSIFENATSLAQMQRSRVNAFVTYGMLLDCQINKGGLTIELAFDTKILPHKQGERLVTQFENILCQLCAQDASQRKLRDFDTVSSQDLTNIRSWNSSIFPPDEMCVHEMIAQTTLRQPNAVAIHSWMVNLLTPSWTIYQLN